MRLTEAEAHETRGYLRARGLTVEAAARLVDKHRTTLHKKLQPGGDISALELIELGEAVGRTGGKP